MKPFPIAALLICPFAYGISVAQTLRSAGGATGWRSVPSLRFNLDLPPETRYVEVATRFNSSIWNFYNTLFAHDAALTNALYAMVDKRGPEPDAYHARRNRRHRRDDAPAREVRPGRASPLRTADAHGARGKRLVAPGPALARYRAAGALAAARPGCTGIVATNTADGTVVHARNMDLAPVKLFAPLVYEGVFTRNGSVVFRAEMVAGYVSLLTGYRPGAYVVERNTRYPAHKGGNREMLIICSAACRCRAGRCGA